MPLPITTASNGTLTALALARAAGFDARGLVYLYAVAVAACWDGPLPWHEANAAKAREKQSELKALESWLASPVQSRDPANVREYEAGRRDAIKLKSEIRALTATRYQIPLGVDALTSEGEAILSGFVAANIPVLAIVQEGQRILAEADSLLTAGYSDYIALDAQGFSTAPTGSVSAGALNSPLATEAMPSGGLR